MRSIRTMLLLAATAALAVAFIVPAAASASSWTEKGTKLTDGGLRWAKNGTSITSKAALGLQGKISFSSTSLGSVTCEDKATLNVEPGGKANVSGFEAAPSSCELTGFLQAVCAGGVTAVTPKSQPWNATITEQQTIAVSGVNIAFSFKGGIFCPTEVIYSGTLTGTPMFSPSSIKYVSFAGTVEAKDSAGNPLGSAAASGTPSVSPSGEYGIITVSAVALSGSLGWASGEDGAMTCPSNSGTLVLEPGSEGKVTAFNWGACSLTGSIAEICNSVTSVTSNSLPWKATDQGSSIKLSNISFTVSYSGSKCKPETFTGELTATPNNKSAISSTSISGSLSTGVINRNWSGSLKWNPAGVYGL